MAYKCTKYDKIIVGPKKTCESCEISDLESKCEYRVWQEGVLKVRKERNRNYKKRVSSEPTKSLPIIFALDISGLIKSGKAYLRYILGTDERYYFSGSIPENLNTEGISVLEVLTREDVNFVQGKNWDYSELLKLKEIRL